MRTSGILCLEFLFYFFKAGKYFVYDDDVNFLLNIDLLGFVHNIYLFVVGVDDFTLEKFMFFLLFDIYDTEEKKKLKKKRRKKRIRNALDPYFYFICIFL